MKLTAAFEKVPEGYIGFVEELPGANVQERTLEEAKQSLREVVRLMLEANREDAEKLLKGKARCERGVVFGTAMKRREASRIVRVQNQTRRQAHHLRESRY
jgi:predicted RNase H-like HicB family nuclease